MRHERAEQKHEHGAQRGHGAKKDPDSAFDPGHYPLGGVPFVTPRPLSLWTHQCSQRRSDRSHFGAPMFLEICLPWSMVENSASVLFETGARRESEMRVGYGGGLEGP